MDADGRGGAPHLLALRRAAAAHAPPAPGGMVRGRRGDYRNRVGDRKHALPAATCKHRGSRSRFSSLLIEGSVGGQTAAGCGLILVVGASGRSGWAS